MSATLTRRRTALDYALAIYRETRPYPHTNFNLGLTDPDANPQKPTAEDKRKRENTEFFALLVGVDEYIRKGAVNSAFLNTMFETDIDLDDTVN